ncbi:MAG: HEAT repeat domain-containing protein [Anaerolineae bacterium]|nr:HEAT repeat domain-containing protein [Anaerolineae bacterium]MCO5188142.1 HEAT repeat domain-containing protein [Anaerolineae bacterium]MCO5193015.1 HEAT repeat domain-containing protein [Anaerolineae bacterium]MCO5205617.1 HEAT repeat domain-containing protein [Anaerolineae bacterium]
MMTSPLTQAEKHYCDQVARKYSRLKLSGLPERDPNLHSVPLERIFVKLQTEVERVLPVEREAEDESKSTLIDRGGDLPPQPVTESNELGNVTSTQKDPRRQESRIIRATKSVDEALHQYRHLSIVGGSGSGKTTLMLWLTLIFAREEQARAVNLGEKFAQARLPILLELRYFADTFADERKNAHVPDLVQIIVDYIDQDVSYKGVASRTIQEALAEGRCILLVDGVDEIVDLKARREFARALDGLFTRSDGDYASNLCLITSRQHGLRDLALRPHFQTCYVKPFSADDVEQFLKQWYEAAYGNEASDVVATLFTQLEQNKRVMALATNPLLCTIIAIVYRNNRVLPHRRAELYLKCCETLLDRWERDKGIEVSDWWDQHDWQTKLELLAALAYWLHGEENRIAATEENCTEQLAQIFLDKGRLSDLTYARQEARHFLQAVRNRSGLISERGDSTFEFVHLTFQEYLAARHIAAQDYPEYLDAFMQHYLDPWWREAHLLAIGHLGSTGDTAEKASQIILAMLHFHRQPMRLLRPTFSPSTQRVLGLVDEHSTNRITEWIIGVPLLLPLLLQHRIAGSLARLQWQRRIAWLAGRNFVAASTAFAECSPLGVCPEVEKVLREQASYWLVQILNDPGLHIGIRNMSQDRDEFTLFGKSETPQEMVSDSELYERCLSFLIGDTTLVAPIVAAINNPDPEIQQVAIMTARSLELRHHRIVTAIETLLDNPDVSPDVQETIFSHIAFLTEKASRTIPILERGVAIKRSYAGYRAITALGELEGLASEDVALLHPLLKTTENSSVRNAIAKCMAQADSLTSDSAKILMEKLIEHSEDHPFITYGIKALSKHSQSLPICRAHLKHILESDADKWLRRRAAEQLGNLPDADAEIIESLVNSMRDEDEVEEAAAKALARIGASNQIAVNRLIDIAVAADLPEGARYVALNALSEMPNVPTNRLLGILESITSLSDYYLYNRATIGKSFLENSAHLIPVACQLAADGINDTVVRYLILVFGELRYSSPCIMDTLVYFIETNDQDLAALSAQQLARIAERPTAARSRLIALLESDSDVRVPVVVAYGLHKRQIPNDIQQALSRLLKSHHDQIRLAAAAALLESRGYVSEAVDSLLNVLLHGSVLNRSLAAHHLASAEFARPLDLIVHALAYSLGDPATAVRTKAAESLDSLWKKTDQYVHQFGMSVELDLDQSTVPQIEQVSLVCMSALTNLQSEVPVQVAAATWFEKYPVAQGDVADALVQAARDPSERVQQVAMRSLGRSGVTTSEVISVLLEALAASDDLQDMAAESLKLLGVVNASILHALLTSRPDRPVTKWQCLQSTIKSLMLQQPQHLPKLTGYLSYEHDARHRRRAAKALGELLVVEGATIALLSVAHDDDVELRRIVSESFGRYDANVPLEAVDVLIKLLGDNDPGVQSGAVRALIMIRHRDALIEAHLREALRSSSSDQLKRTVAYNLIHAGKLTLQTMNVLVTFVVQSNDSRLQRDMLRALHDKPWSQHHERLLPAAISLTRDPDLEYNDRRHLNWDLDDMIRPEPEPVDALASILSAQDENADTLQWVAHRLGKLNPTTQKAISVLLDVAVSDDDLNLKRAADKSLQALTESSNQAVEWVCKQYDQRSSEDKIRIVHRLATLKQPNREAIQILQDVIVVPDHPAKRQAAEGLAAMQAVDEVVVEILIENMDEPLFAGESTALRILSTIKITDDEFLKDVLIRLLKNLHANIFARSDLRRGLMMAIDRQARDRPLLNDKWEQIELRQERLRRWKSRTIGFIIAFLILVVLLFIGGRLAHMDQDDPWVRLTEILSWLLAIGGGISWLMSESIKRIEQSRGV